MGSPFIFMTGRPIGFQCRLIWPIQQCYCEIIHVKYYETALYICNYSLIILT